MKTTFFYLNMLSLTKNFFNTTKSQFAICYGKYVAHFLKETNVLLLFLNLVKRGGASLKNKFNKLVSASNNSQKKVFFGNT